MNREESTVANADIWSKYFRDQWSWLGRGSGADTVDQVAAGAAARVAGFLTFVAAGPIALLYAASAHSRPDNVRLLRPVPADPVGAAPLAAHEARDDAAA